MPAPSRSLRPLLLALGLLVVLAAVPAHAGQKVLFDAAHAENAGNADWTIDGAYSSFADALRQEGYTVEAHNHGLYTPQELSQCAAVVLPEPNSAFTSDEQRAFVAYVQQGGGLFAIADHAGSDRNHDGIDAVGVLNQFVPQLGVRFEQTKFSEAPVSGTYTPHPVTAGVNAIGMWAGSTITLTQPSAKTLVTLGAGAGAGAGHTYVAVNELAGGGRIVAIGDSSPFDDGTAHPGHKVYDGWHHAGMQDGQLAVNAVVWLTHREQAPSAVSIGPRDATRVRNFSELGHE